MDSPDNEKPVRTDDVRPYSVADELVLYDAARNVAYSFNTSATAVWELCDGKHSVDQIAENLEDLLEMPRGALRTDVQALVQQLKEHTLVRPGARSEERE